MVPNNDPDIFRILVATDNHLGYAEKDPERGNDSFNTFKEILELADEQQADFILLGGDLFHENKPSRECQHKCTEMLRTHTFGDKAVEFELVSDPAENFPHLKNPVVNFHDPNLNIAIPVFSIHGNHDDPAGPGQLCALDVLSSAGLINYFGRNTNLKEVNITPLLLEKGTTKLAIFGLSAIKDDRLFRLFKENRVCMQRPRENEEEWFNVFVLHQNHVERPPTNYIPENFLDDFIDLVIWGHEHECKVEPQAGKGEFYVMQPGSSVATSLCEGESVLKQVALLEVKDRAMKSNPLPLRTVRPLVFKNVSLVESLTNDAMDDDIAYNTREARVEHFIETTVNQMIEDAKAKLTGHPRQPTKPLLRLRVEYADETDLFNVVRFGHRFVDQVANPEDIILFRKFRKNEKKADGESVDKDAMDAVFQEDIEESRVEDLVAAYFSELEPGSDQQLQLMTERGLATAVTSFVDRDDRDAVESIMQHQIKRSITKLAAIEDLTEDTVEFFVNQLRDERAAKHDYQKQEQAEAEAALDATDRPRTGGGGDEAISDDMSDDDNNPSEAPVSARGRGSRGGRGARGARGARGGPGSRGGRGSRGARGRGTSALDFSSATSSLVASTRNKVAPMFTKQSTNSPRSSGSSRKGVCFDSDSD